MPANKTLHDFATTPTRIVIFLFVALTLVALMGVAITSRNRQSPDRNNPNSVPKEVVTLSPHTIIYGSWTSNASLITAYDLSTGREGIIAALPIDIKKVTVTSPDTLIFINGVTGAQDHGREIVLYNLTLKSQETIYRASEGFGIDDYVVSPDFKSLAVWETQLNDESGTLLDGKSSVYTLKVGSQTKNVIYEENVTIDNPVRYPRAILNDGTVFMDRFLPNSGAGWAYGMSVSNFNGSQKEDLADMRNGTYGTQPVLSPDGKYLAFAGYEGTNGTTLVDGYRRALVAPNTVELLDTATRQRVKQTNLANSNIYPFVDWNNESNLLIASQGTSEENTGTFNYDITTKTLTRSDNPGSDQGKYLVQQLSPNAWLVGTQDPSPSMTGNLGKTYEAPYTAFSIYNPQTKTTTDLQTATELKQLIAVLPATSFGSFTTIIEKSQPSEDNLQLKTFSVKSEVAPTRGAQQTDPPKGQCVVGSIRQNQENPNCPKCRDLAAAQCGITYQAGLNLNNSCFVKEFRAAKTAGQCYDSPLYLYGKAGENVRVNILTPVSETNPSQNGTFDVVLEENGMMGINGKSYDSIDFNYTSAVKRITPPKYGSFIKKSELTQTVKDYSQKLGLNEKETKDLHAYAQSVVYSPYVFVSFFDHATSNAILPITFDPKPDVYRNIVFYFKNLETPLSYSPNYPEFEKIERKGFTAVEISGITE